MDEKDEKELLGKIKKSFAKVREDMNDFNRRLTALENKNG